MTAKANSTMTHPTHSHADDHKPQAVIYCRVSSAKQVRQGHGLDSQETRCRDFAKHRGYEVAQTFHDEGVSGGLIDRPGIQAMLTFLKAHKARRQHIVLIDDISRLARDIRAHLDLRLAVEDSGGKLESPSIAFGTDSDSILVENLLASVSQHQRQKNAEQVVNRMKARFMNGYYIANPPVGYHFERVDGHGKLIVPHEPDASIAKEAIEGFASGRFGSQAEVKRFLESQPQFRKDRRNGQTTGEVHYRRVESLLKNPVYAGYMNAPSWNITLQPGKHEPLVSFEVWQRNQDKLNGKIKALAVARQDTRPEFPLRGTVACGCCNHPMTAAWSKGRNAHYGYYFCQVKGCDNYRKNIRKEQIESDFEALLRQLRPGAALMAVFRSVLAELWDERQTHSQDGTKAFKADIATLERKAGQIMDRLLATDSATLISVYENEIKRIENDKIALTEKLRAKDKPRSSFETLYRTGCEFLANPWKLWISERSEDRRILLRLAFDGPLAYNSEAGYRTAQFALPFKVLAGLEGAEKRMVGPEALKQLNDFKGNCPKPG